MNSLRFHGRVLHFNEWPQNKGARETDTSGESRRGRRTRRGKSIHTGERRGWENSAQIEIRRVQPPAQKEGGMGTCRKNE